MEVLNARRTLLEMAQRDVEQLRELRVCPAEECHQLVAEIADRLARTIVVLLHDTERMEALIDAAR